MRAMVWSLRILVFLVLFAFAVKNTDPVTLRFFFGAAWQAPMIIILFAFFAGGALFGLLAVASPFIRMRRELSVLQRVAEAGAKQPLVAPPADVAQD